MAKRPKPSDYPRVECSNDLLWEIYKDTPAPRSISSVHKAVLARNITCSESWVKQKMKNLKFAQRLVMLQDPSIDHTVVDAKNILLFLATIGKDFDPYTTLTGIQVRLLTVVAQRAGRDDVDPTFLNGLMQVYTTATVELQKTYQYKLASGELINAKQAAAQATPAVDDEKVTPFSRKPVTAQK